VIKKAFDIKQRFHTSNTSMADVANRLTGALK